MEEIDATELDLSTLQGEVASLEADIKIYRQEMHRYRQEIQLLDRETLAVVTEVDTLRRQRHPPRPQLLLIERTNLYCLKYHHNEILQEALDERFRLSRCQDKLLNCFNQLEAKKMQIPPTQKRLIDLLAEMRKKTIERTRELQEALSEDDEILLELQAAICNEIETSSIASD